jgi:hypothetical protein
MFLSACIKAPDFPDEPVIAYIGINKDTLIQNSLNSDSIFLKFSFTDGDGDFGTNPTDPIQNIILLDTRTGETHDRFKSPVIPKQGTNNGIKGEVTLRVFTTCCLFPEGFVPCDAPPQIPTDTLSFEIYITDQAGNESNHIISQSIILKCD